MVESSASSHPIATPNNPLNMIAKRIRMHGVGVTYVK